MAGNWPKDYPSHITLPPTEASPINEVLYRMVENDPPISTDFLASYKDPMQKHLVNKYPDLAKLYGTSFFKTADSVQLIMKESPEKFKSKKIATGKVVQAHGVAIIGKSAHVSVWFYDAIFPPGFKLI